MRIVAVSLAALAVAGSIPAFAQSSTWEHVALGEIREVHVWQDPSVSTHQEIWTAEDGGRIRHGDRVSGTTTWSQQQTPDEVRQRLLDVFFLDDGDTGFACGADGAFITTTNGGNTWTKKPDVLNSGSAPALLWGSYFFSASSGVLVGDRLFATTSNGGTTWSNVTFTGGHHLGEYYAVDFAVSSGGNAYGAAVNEQTIVYSVANITSWAEATLYDRTSTIIDGGTNHFATGFEFWDVCFAPNPSNAAQAFGIAIGGVLQGDTRVFATTDSGATWHEESWTSNPNTAGYGVFVWSGGNAIAVGYNSLIAQRNPSTGVWKDVSPSTSNGLCTVNGDFTGPLVGVDGTASGDIWIGGAFGYIAHKNVSTVPPTQIVPTHDIPNDRMLWRTKTTAWRDAQTGYVGSQGGIGKTTDYGVNWSMDACTDSSTSIEDIALGGTGRGVAVGGRQSGGTAAWYLNGSGVWTASSFTSSDLVSVGFASSSIYFAVGPGDVVFGSADHGATWSSVVQVSGHPSLKAIAVIDANTAVVVGSASGVGVAYALTNLTTTPGFLALNVSDPGTVLNGVAARLAGATLTVVAVGGDIDMDSDPLTDDDEGIAAVLDIGTLTFFPITNANRAVAHDYRAVALPAGSTHAFIGGARGTMLRYDGSSWDTMKCWTSKDVNDLWFASDALGYAAALSIGGDADASKGILGDGCVVGWR